MKQLRLIASLALIPALGACVTSEAAPQRAPTTTARPDPARVPATNPAPPPRGFRAAPVMNVPGLEYVVGQNADGLQRLFGQPRLNVTEGDVRKLQFGGEACILDVYLYPPRPGGEPTATYVDARRASDGLDVDRVACANALKR